MGRRGVEVIIQFLHVLAMAALAVGQAKQAFLKNRILAVPQREREAEPRLLVAEAGETVLAPAIDAAAGVVVREIIPGIAVGRIVFAHRAPLALGKIRPPTTPVFRTGVGGVEAGLFGGAVFHGINLVSDG